MPLSSNPPENSHMSWAKERALKLAETGKLKEAIDSMVSDVSKDPESAPNMSFIYGMAMALKNDPQLDKKAVVEWIKGFPE
jgi:hypothetical protein